MEGKHTGRGGTQRLIADRSPGCICLRAGEETALVASKGWSHGEGLPMGDRVMEEPDSSGNTTPRREGQEAIVPVSLLQMGSWSRSRCKWRHLQGEHSWHRPGYREWAAGTASIE